MTIEELRKQLSEARARMAALIETAKTEARSLTAEEGALFDEIESEITARKEDLRRAEKAEAEARDDAAAASADDARRAKAAEGRVALGLGDDPNGSGVRVKSEERTYAKRNGRSYFADLARMQIKHDADAAARLERHAREIDVEARANPRGPEARALGMNVADIESRGLTTTVGAGGAFVPPMYLEDEFVAFVREARPFADSVRRFPLPKGTDSINIPKVQTGTATAIQSTQLTNVVETDMTDEFISAPVKTLAGQQTVSLQLVEQSPLNFDEIIYQDLGMALAQNVDNYVLSDASQGVLNVSSLNAETYTDASPTLAKLYPWIAKGLADIRTNRHLAATAIWMTPDRWYWAVSQLDSANRPLVVPAAQGPYNATASMSDTPPVYEPAGSMLGVPVYLDANLPSNGGTGTNQDTIIVARMPDLYLYEGAITARALPQTLGNELAVLIQTYQYIAALPNRYSQSIATVTGTGLVTPTW